MVTMIIHKMSGQNDVHNDGMPPANVINQFQSPANDGVEGSSCLVPNKAIFLASLFSFA